VVNSKQFTFCEDLLKLDNLLLKYDATIINSQMLQGFFVALICTPILIMPDEYTPVIWGRASPDYNNIEEISFYTRITNALWNDTVDQLLQKKPFSLVIEEDAEGNRHIDYWIEAPNAMLCIA